MRFVGIKFMSLISDISDLLKFADITRAEKLEIGDDRGNRLVYVGCPKCGFMMPRGVKACWRCGYFMPNRYNEGDLEN